MTRRPQAADTSRGSAPLDAAAIAAARRSPVVDPGGVTFVYHGAADAVNLRVHVPGVGPTQAREQIARLGAEVLGPLRAALAVSVPRTR